MPATLLERRETARPASEIEYSGTEETPWADVDKSLEAYVMAYGTEDEQDVPVSELSEETKSEIAARTILGDENAETVSDLISVPVVNPETDNLNRGALNAARAAAGGARGADLPDADGVSQVAGELLEDQYGGQEEALDLRTTTEQEEMSFEDLRNILHSELVELERPGDQWLHIEAVFDDRLVYSIQNGPLWQRTYEMDENGNVTFGDRVEVTRHTVYEPKGSEGMDEGDVRESAGQPGDLLESFPQGQAFAEARVDRRQNVIQNVSLLGRVSRNGRVYTDRAMNEAAELYSGVKFYIDHPAKSELKERDGIRSVHDLAGRVLNPRKVGDQVRGDLELLDREPTKSLVFSLAEQMPEVVGNSHRARGDIRVDEDGTQIVESLTHVFGMELVTEPATTDGLLESLSTDEGDTEMKIGELTLTELRESRPDIVRQLLSEEQKEERFQNLQEQVKELEPKAEKADELEGDLEEANSRIEELESENEDLKEQVAEFEEAEQLQARKDLIREKLEEKDLGKNQVPKPLFEQMLNAESEDKVDELIEAIVQIAGNGSSKNGGSGGGGPMLFERDPDEEISEGGDGKSPVTDEVVEEAYSEMFS